MPLKAVRRTVTETDLHEDCKGLILAVSGGPDSMAMLGWYLENPPGFPLIVAHVHHGLRPESDQEAETLRSFCEASQIPFRMLRCSVREEMEKGETVESAARRIRYGFFRTLAEETGATHLATAHTADDQCETVLLHLIHGAGPRGLGGILPKRREGALTVIRPLLNCTKQETVAFCDANNIPYATDPSNQDLAYTRNRIRHRVLPELEAINPRIREALCRTAKALQAQQQALELRTEAFLQAYPELPLEPIRSLPEGERAELLRTVFAREGKILSAEQTDQALALLSKGTGSVEFDRKYRLYAGQGRLILTSPKPTFPPVSVTKEETPLPDGRTLRLIRGTVTKENRKDAVPPILPLILDHRRPGDAFRTSGGTKTLKKQMNERKIPQPFRDRLLLLRTENRLVWCEGLGANQETAPKEGDEAYFPQLSAE